MITNLVQIRRLGEQKRAENRRFRVYLKTHDYVERRLRKISQEIHEQIDCTQCANCCKVATVDLIDRDIEKMARFLRISQAQFVENYTMRDEEGQLILRRSEQGCVFLSGNDCTVYEARPRTCEYFPHLLKGEGPISTRMWQFVDRATYCPIVYNSLEAFKMETEFRR